MEAYKSFCPDCKCTYFWVGFKTGIGKTAEQLAQMKKESTVCRNCGSMSLNTTLDVESEDGKAMQEMYGDIASLLFGK